MKKLYFYLMMMMLAGFTMTSCETDEEIARKLTGVDWEGNLNTYYSNRWGDYFQDGEYRTVWRFEGSDRSGWGEECDYDYYDRRNRAYSKFHWEVCNGNIYIDYDDRTWNPVRIDYYNYTLTYNRFHGTMYDWEDRAYEFDLYANSSWRWDDYDDYDGWDYFYGYTRGADGPRDSTDVYVGENGSYATGTFAKALKEMAAEKK